MKRERTISLKTQTLALVCSMMLPLMVIIAVFDFYTVDQSTGRVHENGVSTMALYQNSLEGNLRHIESTVVSLPASEMSYWQMGHKLEPYERYACLFNIFNRYKDLMSTYSMIGAMYLYSDKNEVSRTEYQGKYPYEFKQSFESTMAALMISQPNPTQYGWFYQQIGGRNMLLRAIGKDGLFTVCMVDPENIAAPQSLAGDGGQVPDGVLLYATPEGTPVTENGFVEENEIRLQAVSNGFYLTGWPQHYMVSMLFSEYSGSWLVYLQPYGGVFGSLDLFQSILIIISLVLCLLLPAAIYTLNRSGFRPMAHLIDTMKQIQGGQLDTKMEERYRIREFQTLSTTFNELMEQIKHLKIESYEKEISEQKTQLLLLQSQIRPHFYLNCLKNIQALAQQNQCDTIQTLVVELSNYLRYLFQSPSSMVPLREELRSVSHYIELQRLTNSHPPECVLCVPEELQQTPVPPLSLLTFVENAVKHARPTERSLSVHIKAILLESEDGSYLNLTITDNGQGFPPHVLETLNSGDPHFETGHIGITNVLRRLELIYQKRSSCSFFNLQEGSCIDIFLPLDDRVLELPETSGKGEKEGNT